ncbi:peptidoglycan DD-metalloendopeptidase family protein [Ulvibacterium sp.]|uniref:peptidoglycan DD-metalloendopeptidase family protein n=1 Tax=Ulvibacterium sp. TaxID=2665914 RepID=UPI002607C69A|nr:peptidoglycan DD-metalloendopeptidase family protein [Ulvibacterium sp.]
MKGVLCALAFVVGITSSHSQEELGNYAVASAEFMALYNNADYEGIFNRFDADMKKALPRERTLRFFTQNVNNIMGNIQSMQFFGFKRGAHLYRTVFDRAVADVLISLNTRNEISGLYISPSKPLDFPLLERNSTPMILPFREEWFVYWGGTTLEQNYHVAEISQQYAYDLLMVSDGSSYQGDSRDNESYLVYGKEIIAPCDARVAKVITGVPDNIPGETNPNQLTGNTVVLETPVGEYLLFAHLKNGSILVEEGADVLQGEPIGQCGNSGNSTEPHLHLSLQNDVEMENSTGARLYFDRILVNGEIMEDYLPVKEDFIRNIN